jgi:hypothetical protein
MGLDEVRHFLRTHDKLSSVKMLLGILETKTELDPAETDSLRETL